MAIVSGLVVEIVFDFIPRIIYSRVLIHSMETLSIEKYELWSKGTQMHMNLTILTIISYLGLLLGGVTAGLFSREHGWKFGLTVGLITALFPFATILISFLFPNLFLLPNSTAANNALLSKWTMRALTSVPYDLIPTIIGGFIGQSLATLSRDHEKTV